jgi:hypothetical protein
VKTSSQVAQRFTQEDFAFAIERRRVDIIDAQRRRRLDNRTGAFQIVVGIVAHQISAPQTNFADGKAGAAQCTVDHVILLYL